MTTTIEIKDRVSTTDIDGWRFGEETDFFIGTSTSFEPGVHGLALSVLRSALQRRSRLVLICDFEEPENPDIVSNNFFGTAFGMAIARIAKEIRFGRRGTKASPHFKPNIATCYKNSAGVIGDGRQRSLICVDPRFPIPPVLEDSETNKENQFPMPSVFERILKRQAEEMGLTKLFSSSTEAPLISFVYELLRNTSEHGIPSAPAIPRSTRALILEKIALQGSDIGSRRISADLRSYLLRIKETTDLENGFGVLCITVADQGDGIQKTLPSRNNESEEQTLARAFLEGESRKAHGAIERGRGLTNALTAAFRLSGMLQVCSAGLLGIQDFSSGDSKYPTVSFSDAKRFSSELAFGTSISLFIPESHINPDQRRLFTSSRP